LTSKISDILSSYKTSLKYAKEVYEHEYNFRVENAINFYNYFLKNLIVDLNDLKITSSRQTRIVLNAQRIFGDKITFVAIDGTCFKEKLEPYVVFFSAAYGVRGALKFQEGNKQVKYEKWDPAQDKSVIAYLPIPFARLSQLAENDDYLLMDDEQKFNYVNIHLSLMRLAELYLAYSFTQLDIAPNLILLDTSISSSFNTKGIGRYKKTMNIGIKDKEIMGFRIDDNDIRIAYSHPYNERLKIPTSKEFMIVNYILSIITKPPYQITFDDLFDYLNPNLNKNLDVENKEKLINRYIKRIEKDININESSKLIIIDHDQMILKLNPRYKQSWNKTKSLIGLICKNLLEEKKNSENSGLIYSYFSDDSSEELHAWYNPDDIIFLTAVIFRMLIEECWRKKILLVGIAKDSSTSYFSKNYLEVFKNHNTGNEFEKYDIINSPKLPWSDRLLLEAISYCNSGINCPWCTIELDSAIITLRKFIENNIPVIKGSGHENDIYYPERMFGRFLAQFYINRSKIIPNAGHVIFVDRLFMPDLDNSLKQIYLGIPSKMKIFFHENNKQINEIQEIIMFVLDRVTKNLFPEVIGYPDPLHKADWGAKSLGDKIRPMIMSSQIILKFNPLNKTLRQLRTEGRR